MLPKLLDAFRALPPYRAVKAALPSRGERVGIIGLPGSSAAVMLAALVEEVEQRVFLVVAPAPGVAERWFADLDLLLGDVARLYPPIHNPHPF